MKTNDPTPQPYLNDSTAAPETSLPALPGSLFEDPSYQARAWSLQLAYLDRNPRALKLTAPESQEVQHLRDALKGRDLGILKNRAVTLGTYSIAANGYVDPDWDLLEFAAVYDAEPLVRKAITRQLNLWFKSGFDIVGDNAPVVEYIRKRFRQIAYATGIPTMDLLKSTVRSLLKYSNAFLIKVRNTELSGGIQKKGRKQPIAGYLPVSPLTIYPQFKNGKLERWSRYVHGGTILHHPPDDVIHFAWDREEDFLWGKPRMLGVVEDVAALRRIEENVEVLLAKYLFPIYHVIVGTETRPCVYYPDGTSELDAARATLATMDQEGMAITSERYKIDVIGAFRQAMDASPYLQHFKSRVYAGLGISAVDMGEGDTANRATADNISQNLKDLVIEDQAFFSAQVQLYMFAELLLEHPDNISPLNTFEQVQLRFANVDLDSQIKHENHAVNLFNNNGITQTELRKELGYLPLDEPQRADMNFELFQLSLALIAAVDESYQPDPNTGAMKPSGPSPEKSELLTTMRKRANPVATADQPENQHGKALGPTKRKSSVESDLLGSALFPLVDALIDCDGPESARAIILSRFSHISDQKRILSIVDEVYSDLPPRHLRRAALVVALGSIRDLLVAC